MADHVANIVVLEGKQQRIWEMKEQVKMENHGLGSLDFEKVVPRPESLMITHGPSTKHCMDLYLSAVNPRVQWCPIPKMNGAEFRACMDVMREKQELGEPNAALTMKQVSDLQNRWLGQQGFLTLSDMLKLGQKAVGNVLNHGHATWYEWGYENWGTPKNAFGFASFCGGEGTDQKIRFLTEWTHAAPVVKKLSKLYPDLMFVYQSVKLTPGAFIEENYYKAGMELVYLGADEVMEEEMQEAAQDVDPGVLIMG